MGTPAPILGKLSANILGHRMAWVEGGAGPPLVLLHGNLASSYLWRKVLGHLEGVGRLIAPDLMGMGSSDKLHSSDPHRYSFDRQRAFLDALLAHLGVTKDVVLAGLGWGAVLAFDWANRHRAATRGLCYMETFVRPMGWEDVPNEWVELLARLRTDEGDGLVLRRNLLIKQVLPALSLRRLGLMERLTYGAPFRRPDDRLPLLKWCRQLPIEGSPRDVVEEVEGWQRWLASEEVPKLFVNAEPGLLLTGAMREECRGWANQQEVTVEGIHLLPEDSPDDLGGALAEWCRGLPS